MKINGIVGLKPRIVSLVLPLSDDTQVEFKFRPLTSDDDFEKVLAQPTPPERIIKGGARIKDYEDAGYKAAILKWSGQRNDWSMLKSMSETDDLEFETVKSDDPETWGNWKKEFDAIFGDNALGRVYIAYADANSLSEDTLEKARKSFLASRQAAAENLSAF